MIGAIIGDIAGSRFEFHNIRSRDFKFLTKNCYFTDDSVMSICVAEALMKCDGDYTNLGEVTQETMRRIGRHYPGCGYGGRFNNWMFSDMGPYNSFGNGSAMRVSAVGHVAKTMDEAIELSRKVTEITHNHPEGIKGAEATAVAVYMADKGYTKEQIRHYIEATYYRCDETVDEIHEWYYFDETCQLTMPYALQCFYDADSYEETIRNCMYIGGDCDTTAAIAGGIAGAYYGVPQKYMDILEWILTDELMEITDRFVELTGIEGVTA